MPARHFATFSTLLLLGSYPLCSAAAQPAQEPHWAPQFLGAQVTVIGQHLAPFAASYAGPKSLVSGGDTKATDTFGAYFGARLIGHLQAYLDLEMARGGGVGNATGLGGITNGDVIRQGTANLGRGPYVARAFLRYVIPLGSARDTLGRAMDQLSGAQPGTRLEVMAGKLAASDEFDQNRYANSTRTQFLNWGLFQNTAWDFAADTRGYTWGAVTAWVTPHWVLRLGTFAMPTMANGNIFDSSFPRARGDNVELTVQPGPGGTTARLLVYENRARMGNYRAALARAAAVDSVPDVVADDRPVALRSDSVSISSNRWRIQGRPERSCAPDGATAEMKISPSPRWTDTSVWGCSWTARTGAGRRIDSASPTSVTDFPPTTERTWPPAAPGFCWAMGGCAMVRRESLRPITARNSAAWWP